jgi:hypothetical protein
MSKGEGKKGSEGIGAKVRRNSKKMVRDWRQGRRSAEAGSTGV